jgi:methylated-DNA-[protein]-cysteine S-methyltransferase
MSPEKNALARCCVDTPIGTLVLAATSRGLKSIDLVGAHAAIESLHQDGPGQEHLQTAERALRAYFARSLEGFGRRASGYEPRDAGFGLQASGFGDVLLAPEGTPFQQSVWKALRTIPCGTTISYRTLAERIGRPAAMRAVGLANGRNPLPIIVPCHRVIGADGTLTGFGLGVDVKAWLLVHEGAAAPFAGPVTPKTHLTPRGATLF